MTKIGILTFHNNANRGAILQAYALSELAKEVFNGDIEIVDYRTSAKEWSRKMDIFVSRQPSKTVQRLRDWRIINAFLNSSLPTSDESITTDNHREAVNWLERQKYDILISGSDEVWKIHEDSRNSVVAKVSPRRPFPNLYYLGKNITGMKVAYAASSNGTDFESLSDDYRRTLRNHLEAFDAISVRDNHTQEMLQRLDFKEIHRVPDPTLMMKIPKPDVKPILEELNIDLQKPILGFHCPDLPIFKNICEMYRERGYQIVATRSSSFADVELNGMVDPFEYYAMYEYFDMVVTSSLHSTIFSLKNGTPFATIDVNDAYAKLESKTHSLLEEFSLHDRHIDVVNGNESEFYNHINRLEEDLNERHIEDRIKRLQKYGFEFLETVKETYETSSGRDSRL